MIVHRPETVIMTIDGYDIVLKSHDTKQEFEAFYKMAGTVKAWIINGGGTW